MNEDQLSKDIEKGINDDLARERKLRALPSMASGGNFASSAKLTEEIDRLITGLEGRIHVLRQLKATL